MRAIYGYRIVQKAEKSGERARYHRDGTHRWRCVLPHLGSLALRVRNFTLRHWWPVSGASLFVSLSYHPFLAHDQKSIPRPQPLHNESECWVSLRQLEQIGVALWPTQPPKTPNTYTAKG